MSARTQDPILNEGATIIGYSDRRACTVVTVNVKGTLAVLREDKADLLNGPDSGEPDALKVFPGGFAAHWQGVQRWATEPNPEGVEHTITKRKDGEWREKGDHSKTGARYIFGVRDHFYDYNF